MKYRIVLYGIMLMLLTVCLSGCEEKTLNPLTIDTGGGESDTPLPNQDESSTYHLGDIKITGDINMVEILECDITTVYNEGYGNQFRDGFTVVKCSWNPNQPPVNQEHRISGTAKNIAGAKLKSVSFRVNYLDSNGNIISVPMTKSCRVKLTGVEDGEIFDFKIAHERLMGTDNTYDVIVDIDGISITAYLAE